MTVFLTLGSPVSGGAADLTASPEGSSFWVVAWQWLVAQIAPGEEAAAERESDAGWTIDPDG